MRLSPSRSRCLLGASSRVISRPHCRSFVSSAFRLSVPTKPYILPLRQPSEPPDHSEVTLLSSKDHGRPTRTRFAPSPTGYMHLGSLRTALFNYLVAKASKGQFILRIEDTDQARIVPDAEQSIYDDLNWALLKWDEGPATTSPHGPYRQSERLHIYKFYADKLVEEGKAYRCFCDHRSLDEYTLCGNDPNRPIPDGAFRAGMRYPGKCREVSKAESDQRAADGERHVIRFKSDRIFSFVDAVYGHYEKRDLEEDFVLMKSDGFPTYHLANVVDDASMRITHVIRGEEWLISTPKHLALYDAFDFNPPIFGHLGLLVGPNGEKLSKRAGDMSVRAFRERGFFHLAIKNWLALHGSRITDPRFEGKEIVASMRELVDSFSLNFTKGPIMPNWTKLTRIQQVQLSRYRDISLKGSSHAKISAAMTRPVMRTIHAVESLRRSREPDRTYTFTDLEGHVTGTINVGELGPMNPVYEPIFELAAHDFTTDHLDANRLSPDLEAVHAVNRLVTLGPNFVKVPTDIVLAAANLIWRPTASKLLKSLPTLDQIAIIDYSPVVLWGTIIDGLKHGHSVHDVLEAELSTRLELLHKSYIPCNFHPGQTPLLIVQKKLGALMHAYVRQALAGDHRESTPSTKNTGSVLGPVEAKKRLATAIELWNVEAKEPRQSKIDIHDEGQGNTRRRV